MRVVADLILSMVHADMVLVLLENIVELCAYDVLCVQLNFISFLFVACVSLSIICFSIVVHSIRRFRASDSTGNCKKQINGD